MKITFFSNYLNHHQLSFCKAMFKLTNGEFTFVATIRTPKFRIALGYHDMNKEFPFVLTTYDSQENVKKANKLALESDAVIIGSNSEKYAIQRIKQNKLTFFYSERLYKKGIAAGISLRSLGSTIKHHTRYLLKPVYLLCASCYTAGDYALAGAYIGKSYKWGYFPETYHYDIDQLISNKQEEQSCTLLWVGRLIGWKHPEYAIEIAQRLRDAGYKVSLSIIGEGELRPILETQIQEFGLQNQVYLKGSMSPEEVREEMEKARIFIFTSDYNEGWGAVLNESMNSACATVTSHAIGSAGFLIKDGENGLIYKSGNTDELFQKVKYLLDNQTEWERMCRNAYETIEKEWNPETAAERFVALAESLLNKGEGDLFADGPCSKAKIRQKRR